MLPANGRPAARLGRRESLAELVAVTHRSLDLTRLYDARYLNLSLRRETRRAMRTSRAQSLDESIQAADRAMCKVKASGSNGIEVAAD